MVFFRISSLDEKRGRTFDCGVKGLFTQDSRSSQRDKNVVQDIVPHFGKIEEIMVVEYDAHSKFEEYVFKCRWFRSNLVGHNCTIILEEECGHTRLRTSATSFQPLHWSTSEPFAFPSHLEQCFYMPYPPTPEERSLVVTYVPQSRSIVGEKPDFVITSIDEVDDAFAL